jgi:hypothetical protein
VSTGCHEICLQLRLPGPLLERDCTDGAKSSPAIELPLAR